MNCVVRCPYQLHPKEFTTQKILTSKLRYVLTSCCSILNSSYPVLQHLIIYFSPQFIREQTSAFCFRISSPTFMSEITPKGNSQPSQVTRRNEKLNRFYKISKLQFNQYSPFHVRAQWNTHLLLQELSHSPNFNWF